MKAIKQFAKVENCKVVVSLPAFFQADEVEIIVLAKESAGEGVGKKTTKHKSSPAILGTHIIGDIMSPVIPEKEWEVLQ